MTSFPCCCMERTSGVRVTALLSLLLAVGLFLVSGWLFKDMYEIKNSQSSRLADAASDTANDLFGFVGSDTKVNINKVTNIKLFVSGTVLAAAILQFVSSLLLVLCAGGSKGGPSTAKLYCFINTFTLLAILASIACFFTADGIDYKNDSQIQYFLAACVVDSVYLIYVFCVAGQFLRG